MSNMFQHNSAFFVNFSAMLSLFWGRFWSFLRVPWRILLRTHFLHLKWSLLEAHLSDFGPKLGPKMEPKITKNLWKNSLKNCQKDDRLRYTIFLDFWSIWGAFLEASGPQNHAFRVIHPSNSWKSQDVTSDVENIGLGIDFSRILAPSWVPKSTRNRYRKVLEKWWKNDAAQDAKKTKKLST